jgi:DNA-binding XRE family transcriptional regulator
MPIYDELRHLTKVYMQRHGLTQPTMAAALGVTHRTLCYWCFEQSPKVLRESTINKLVDLLRADGLMIKTISTAGRTAKR